MLVTSGVSERPMAAPPGVPDTWRRAELLMCLPAGWPLGPAALREDRHGWPLRWLRMLARFPHAYGAFLSGGAPFGPDGHAVRFWSLLPLHADEMDYKLRYGVDALAERLEAAGVSDVVDLARPSAVA